MEEIDRADPGARRTAFRFLVIATLLGAGALLAFEHYREALLAWFSADPSRARWNVIFLTLVLALSPLLIAAAWAWTFATRVVRGNRYPPEGAKLIRDTPVVRGAAARLRGRVHQALAGAFLFASLGILWILWQVWRFA
ncbi:MAG: hypothetical protein L0Y43_02405 [Methylococcaceae bacterium]|nr:hypothetical protein [Methylococcaceae bacterium]